MERVVHARSQPSALHQRATRSAPHIQLQPTATDSVMRLWRMYSCTIRNAPGVQWQPKINNLRTVHGSGAFLPALACIRLMRHNMRLSSKCRPTLLFNNRA